MGLMSLFDEALRAPKCVIRAIRLFGTGLLGLLGTFLGYSVYIKTYI
jgi:hypothetical protein